MWKTYAVSACSKALFQCVALCSKHIAKQLKYTPVRPCTRGAVFGGAPIPPILPPLAQFKASIMNDFRFSSQNFQGLVQCGLCAKARLENFSPDALPRIKHIHATNHDLTYQTEPSHQKHARSACKSNTILPSAFTSVFLLGSAWARM